MSDTPPAGAPGAETPRELKVWPQYAAGLDSGDKTFEFRKDDRTPRYEVGDVLWLREWRPASHGDDEYGCLATFPPAYTGREWFRRVTYVARGGVIPEGYCVMAVVPAATPSGAPTLGEREEPLHQTFSPAHILSEFRAYQASGCADPTFRDCAPHYIESLLARLATAEADRGEPPAPSPEAVLPSAVEHHIRHNPWMQAAYTMGRQSAEADRGEPSDEARLRYLLDNIVTGEDGTFTFPDGVSYPCRVAAIPPAAAPDGAIMEAIELTVAVCDEHEKAKVPMEARVVDYAGILAEAKRRAALSAVPATTPEGSDANR